MYAYTLLFKFLQAIIHFIINSLLFSGDRTFASAKHERWWYLAVSNCNSTKVGTIKYILILQSAFLTNQIWDSIKDQSYCDLIYESFL